MYEVVVLNRMDFHPSYQGVDGTVVVGQRLAKELNRLVDAGYAVQQVLTTGTGRPWGIVVSKAFLNLS